MWFILLSLFDLYFKFKGEVSTFFMLVLNDQIQFAEHSDVNSFFFQ